MRAASAAGEASAPRCCERPSSFEEAHSGCIFALGGIESKDVRARVDVLKCINLVVIGCLDS